MTSSSTYQSLVYASSFDGDHADYPLPSPTLSEPGAFALAQSQYQPSQPQPQPQPKSQYLPSQPHPLSQPLAQPFSQPSFQPFSQPEPPLVRSMSTVPFPISDRLPPTPLSVARQRAQPSISASPYCSSATMPPSTARPMAGRSLSTGNFRVPATPSLPTLSYPTASTASRVSTASDASAASNASTASSLRRHAPLSPAFASIQTFTSAAWPRALDFEPPLEAISSLGISFDGPSSSVEGGGVKVQERDAWERLFDEDGEVERGYDLEEEEGVDEGGDWAMGDAVGQELLPFSSSQSHELQTQHEYSWSI